MTTDGKIRDEKLQYYVNREAAKISALSSGKIHKYKFLTGEKILPSDQSEIIEQSVKHLKSKQKQLKSKEKTNRCYYKWKEKIRDFNQ